MGVLTKLCNKISNGHKWEAVNGHCMSRYKTPTLCFLSFLFITRNNEDADCNVDVNVSAPIQNTFALCKSSINKFEKSTCRSHHQTQIGDTRVQSCYFWKQGEFAHRCKGVWEVVNGLQHTQHFILDMHRNVRLHSRSWCSHLSRSFQVFLSSLNLEILKIVHLKVVHDLARHNLECRGPPRHAECFFSPLVASSRATHPSRLKLIQECFWLHFQHERVSLSLDIHRRKQQKFRIC